MKSHVALFNEIVALHDNLLNPSDSKLLQNLSHLPLLLLQGSQDLTASPSASQALFRSLALEDKNIIEYGECDHFVLNDGEWVDLAVRDVAAW